MDMIQSPKSADAVVIEKCNEDRDAAVLAAIAERTFREIFGRLYKQEDLELFLRDGHSRDIYCKYLNNPAYALWLAKEASGEAVGYIVAGPCVLPAPDRSENSGEVIRFYIRDEFQGAGLGQRMLVLALNWLEASYTDIYLSVSAVNYSAQRFYERSGFEKIHEYFYMVGNQADPEFIMKLRRPRTPDDAPAVS
jgi:diamine N-acetyltransferase